MGKQAVNGTGLNRLVWFLNLKPAVLQEWSRDRDAIEKYDKTKDQDLDRMMTYQYLFYNTDRGDDAQALIELQRDLKADIKGLLDPNRSPNEALGNVLDRIDGLALKGYRLALTPEQQIERQQKDKPFTTVTMIRVTPPSKGEKGRRKPMTETVAVKESRLDERARPNFYRILDDAIRNDTISEIRCCLSCETFFLFSKIGRLTYCSPTCETKFNNERRKIQIDGTTEIDPTGRTSNKRPTKKKPANNGYDIFLSYRALILGTPKTARERDKRDHVTSWLIFDSRRAETEFKRACQKLDPEAHWRGLMSPLKKRFESYAAGWTHFGHIG